MQINKKTRNDLILIASVLITAAVIFAIQLSGKTTGSWAVVSVDGKEVARYRLSENSTYVLNNGTNTIEISDKAVRMTDADCPDKLCVKQGKISHNNQCITCLPNKLTVTVTGNESTVDLVL